MLDGDVMYLNEIKKIINVMMTNNIDNSIFFDYFRIVKYKNDDDLQDKKNILFFPVSVSKEELVDKWYISDFDLRNDIEKIAEENPNYIFVIESNMQSRLSNNYKYIVVDNIMESVTKLANYKLHQFEGKIIAVTGSVGKTTTVGLINKVLGKRSIRIYSKRITPLVLNHFLVNYLSNNYEYFIVEASLWKKEHMSYFSKRLKPFLSIILNIYPEHIGIFDIKNISDITKYKSLLLEYSNNLLINNMDDELKKINIINNYVYYEDEKIIPTNVKNIIKIDRINYKIKPYIKTKLMYLEETISYEVGKYFGINDNLILDRLSKAVPVENRINKQTLFQHEIIFDGEVSGVARLERLFEHYYDKAILVIMNLTENGEEFEDYKKIEPLFNNFNCVYINRKVNKYFNDNRIKYINNLDFIRDIDTDIEIFLHYGSYYRKYKEFNISNLEE